MTDWDLTQPLQQVAQLAAKHGLSQVTITDSLTLSWLLGIRDGVREGVSDPAFAVRVTAQGEQPVVRVVAPVNEVDQVRDLLSREVIQAASIEFEAVPWQQWPVSAEMDAAFGSDLVTLRRTMLPQHLARLESLTGDVTAIVEQALLAVDRGVPERELAGVLARALHRRGIQPQVLLIGSGDRFAHIKHPFPSDARLDGEVMVSVGARRHGVVTSVTRIAAFNALRADQRDLFECLLRVEGAFLDASADGVALAEVFDRGTRAYTTHGLGENAWHAHHQGGLAGLAAREVIAGKGESLQLASGMVVAWNPSHAGFKAEDIAIVGPGGATPLGGPGSGWPAHLHHGRVRPGILEKG